MAFGLDGTSYEIDLSDAHARALRDLLRPYLVAARRVSASTSELPRPAHNRSRRRTATMAEIEAVKARARADRA